MIGRIARIYRILAALDSYNAIADSVPCTPDPILKRSSETAISYLRGTATKAEYDAAVEELQVVQDYHKMDIGGMRTEAIFELGDSVEGIDTTEGDPIIIALWAYSTSLKFYRWAKNLNLDDGMKEVRLRHLEILMGVIRYELQAEVKLRREGK